MQKPVHFLLAALFCLIITVSICSTTVFAAEDNYPRQIVRIGCAHTTGYYSHDENGDVSGYGHAYDQMLAQYANWDIEYVEGTWTELQNKLEKGEIDLLGFMVKTQERQTKFAFANSSSGTSMSCLITNREATGYAYQDYASFDGMTVAVQKSNANIQPLLDYAEAKGFHLRLDYYDSYTEVFNALDSGNADAGYTVTYQNLSAYSIIDQLNPTDFYYAVNIENTALLNQLNEALSKIHTYYRSFENDLYTQYYDAQNGRSVLFTNEEQTYLDTKPTVVVVPGARKQPFEYYDSDQEKYCGIIPDVLEQITQITGIQFLYVKDKAAADATNNDNIITSIICDIDWANYLGVNMTQPFVNGTISLITRDDSPLSEIKTVALTNSNYFTQIFESMYPGVSFKIYGNAGECLEAVRKGGADCAALNCYEIDYYIVQGRFRTLHERTVTNVPQNVGLGVSPYGDPHLLDVLSKALLMIPNETYSAIIRSNTQNTEPSTLLDSIYMNPVQFGLIAAMLLTAFSIAGSLVFYTVAIRKKNKAIIQANNAKTDFLSQMSHDMRTPMNAILGLTALSLDEPELSPVIKDNLSNIRNSGEFLLGLVNDVLDMSKIEHGDIELHYEPYFYSDFLANIKSMFAPLCEQNGLKFEFEEVTTTLTIMTDKVRMNQIFFNIFSNAIKYTPEGGTVRYYTENLIVEGNQGSADYIIEDTGIGMSEEFQKHMFEPFQQESSEITANLQGTGLGLSISRQLVELMGGTLRIESKQDVGTRVIIHLCFEIVSSQEKEPEKDKSVDINAALNGRHILVVEDHPLNAAIVEKLLVKVGARVDIATNGKAGVDKFQYSPTGDYDVILMDVRMPVMDGLEATKTIRALEREDAKTVPILAMTANAYESDVQNCLDAGMNAHLAKPVEPATMYKIISEHLLRQKN